MSYEWNKEVEVKRTPFFHFSISNFLQSGVEEIVASLNTLEYYLEEHDLYSFNRTIDFFNVENKTIDELREFFLSEEFISWIEEQTKTTLQRGILELHSLKLTSTHYLLPHDDRVENRKVAFILNLSKDFTKEDGGALELFESKKGKPTKVTEIIPPQFNRFSCFIVSEDSFHQIAEVLSGKERLSISGWYYEA